MGGGRNENEVGTDEPRSYRKGNCAPRLIARELPMSTVEIEREEAGVGLRAGTRAAGVHRGTIRIFVCPSARSMSEAVVVPLARRVSAPRSQLLCEPLGLRYNLRQNKIKIKWKKVDMKKHITYKSGRNYSAKNSMGF